MPLPKRTTWVLVADGSRGRILASDGPGRGIHPVAGREFVNELKASRDLGTDRPGRSFESATVARHAIEPRVDWHRFEKERFARSMADVLCRGAKSGAFEQLVLVAPPQVLGNVRAALDERTRGKIVAEINKDLTQDDDHEIAARVREVVAV